MSDCRKFTSTDANLSPEDRLAEVEKKFSIILERIKAYDEVLDKFKTVSEKINKLEKDQEALQISDKKITEYVALSCDNLSIRIDGFVRSFEDYKRKCENRFDDLDRFQSSLQTQITILRDSKERFEEKISKVSETFITKDEMENHRRYHISFIDTLRKNLEESNKTINHVSESYNDIKTLQQQQSSKLESIFPQVRTFVSDISVKNKEIESSFSRMAAIVSNYATKDDVASEIKSLRNDLEGTPSSLEVTKAEITKRFEIASLDASNSVLKSNNCVKQIELMERKIENLALIVKKYELNK